MEPSGNNIYEGDIRECLMFAKTIGSSLGTCVCVATEGCASNAGLMQLPFMYMQDNVYVHATRILK